MTIADCGRTQEAWFSRFGTLLATAEQFVHRSSRGYFADELTPLLHVEVQDALHQLTQQQRVTRQIVSGRYLYTAAERWPTLRFLRFGGVTGGLAAWVSACAMPTSVRKRSLESSLSLSLRKQRVDAIESALWGAFDETPVPTLTEVARRLGLRDVTRITKRFPDLSAALIRRRQQTSTV